MRTKLFVPEGAPVHSSGGEVSPPSQVYFLGIAPIAENAGDVTLNDEAPPSAAGAMSTMVAANALLQRCAISDLLVVRGVYAITSRSAEGFAEHVDEKRNVVRESWIPG